jgi:hypothetical protein
LQRMVTSKCTSTGRRCHLSLAYFQLKGARCQGRNFVESSGQPWMDGSVMPSRAAVRMAMS